MHTQWNEQQRNREAESAAVRRAAWGEESKPDESADAMGHTILGDVQYPTPIVMQQPNNSLQNFLVLALFTAMAGMGGYMLANRNAPTPTEQPAQVQFDDESVSIGLGRIEDYLKAE